MNLTSLIHDWDDWDDDSMLLIFDKNGDGDMTIPYSRIKEIGDLGSQLRIIMKNGTEFTIDIRH